MKTKKYKSPRVELFDIRIERGFAGSDQGNDNIDFIKGEEIDEFA